jgi:hypothetical protein
VHELVIIETGHIDARFKHLIFRYTRGKGKFTMPLHTQLFKLSDNTNQVQISALMNIKYACIKA